MAALLADWLKSGKPVPEEVIHKWKDVSRLPPAGLESVIRYEAERSMPCEKSAQTLQHALRELAKNVRCGSRGGNWNSPLWFFGYEPGGCRCREMSKYTMLDTDVCSAVDLGFLPDDERFAELNYPYARNWRPSSAICWARRMLMRAMRASREPLRCIASSAPTASDATAISIRFNVPIKAFGTSWASCTRGSTSVWWGNTGSIKTMPHQLSAMHRGRSTRRLAQASDGSIETAPDRHHRQRTER